MGRCLSNPTLQLAALAMLLALVIALPAGVISAVRPNSWWDRVFSVLALTGVAIPNFWLGILLIYGLALFAKLLPPSGFVPFGDDPGENLRHLVLPALTLGLGLAAVLMRQTRSSMLEVLQQDYVVTARAKGPPISFPTRIYATPPRQARLPPRPRSACQLRAHADDPLAAVALVVNPPPTRA